MSANPLDLSHSCTQSLQRTIVSVGDSGTVDTTRTLALLLTSSSLLADLGHSSSAAPGASVAPLGPFFATRTNDIFTFLNTAPLVPAALAAAPGGAGAPTAAAAPAPASRPAPRLDISPLEASRFDTALESSVQQFAAAATALMHSPASTASK
jgi:hypothetical protein